MGLVLFIRKLKQFKNSTHMFVLICVNYYHEYLKKKNNGTHTHHLPSACNNNSSSHHTPADCSPQSKLWFSTPSSTDHSNSFWIISSHPSRYLGKHTAPSSTPQKEHAPTRATKSSVPPATGGRSANTVKTGTFARSVVVRQYAITKNGGICALSAGYPARRRGHHMQK